MTFSYSSSLQPITMISPAASLKPKHRAVILQHSKLSTLLIAGPATIVVVAALVTSHFRSRAIDPRVTVELSEVANGNLAPAGRTVIATTIDGEVARTAERIGEATALTLSVSLYAASEQIRGRAPRSGDLLSGLAARNLLPPGLALTRVEGNLVSTYGNIWVRYRPGPLGVEVISIGHKPSDGPALIVRIPDELSEKGEAKLYVAGSLSAVRVPAPFSPAAEVIALGWSPEFLRSLK
jgi:hypothetical protein